MGVLIVIGTVLLIALGAHLLIRDLKQRQESDERKNLG
jgi:putative Mn2+ efflux pump MntP